MTQDQYQCCFCGRTIADRGIDPCGLAFTAGFMLPPERQASQGFFCHVACFEERLHPSTHLYAKDILEAEDPDIDKTTRGNG